MIAFTLDNRINANITNDINLCFVILVYNLSFQFFMGISFIFNPLLSYVLIHIPSFVFCIHIPPIICICSIFFWYSYFFIFYLLKGKIGIKHLHTLYRYKKIHFLPISQSHMASPPDRNPARPIATTDFTLPSKRNLINKSKLRNTKAIANVATKAKAVPRAIAPIRFICFFIIPPSSFDLIL